MDASAVKRRVVRFPTSRKYEEEEPPQQARRQVHHLPWSARCQPREGTTGCVPGVPYNNTRRPDVLLSKLERNTERNTGRRGRTVKGTSPCAVCRVPCTVCRVPSRSRECVCVLAIASSVAHRSSVAKSLAAKSFLLNNSCHYPTRVQ